MYVVVVVVVVVRKPLMPHPSEPGVAHGTVEVDVDVVDFETVSPEE